MTNVRRCVSDESHAKSVINTRWYIDRLPYFGTILINLIRRRIQPVRICISLSPRRTRLTIFLQNSWRLGSVISHPKLSRNRRHKLSRFGCERLRSPRGIFSSIRSKSMAVTEIISVIPVVAQKAVKTYISIFDFKESGLTPIPPISGSAWSLGQQQCCRHNSQLKLPSSIGHW